MDYHSNFSCECIAMPLQNGGVRKNNAQFNL